jgi:rod shape determining protein RodA
MYEPALNERSKKADWLMLAGVVGLMVVGVMFIASAKMAEESLNSIPWYRQFFFKQILWCGLGLGAAAAVCLVEYHVLARWSLVVYWIMIVWLVLVLIVGTGEGSWGARRWIDLKFFRFQPSEFAKLSFILVQAHFLSRPKEELRWPIVFWKSLGLTVLPFALILREPDLGSALVLLPVGLVMMYVAGLPVRFLANLLGGFGLVVGLLLVDILFAPPNWQIRLEEYQRQRLLIYFGKDFAPPNATPAVRQRARELQRQKAYNTEQALISVGSGGLTGRGWRQGTQSG